MAQRCRYLDVGPAVLHVGREEICVAALDAHVGPAIHLKQASCVHHVECIALGCGS